MGVCGGVIFGVDDGEEDHSPSRFTGMIVGLVILMISTGALGVSGGVIFGADDGDDDQSPY